MQIERLSAKSLEKIFKNNIREQARCVIKFYSNNCRFCESLKEPYHDISEEFEDVWFFVYNIDDDEDIQHIAQLNGVPTIALVETGTRHRVAFLEDPHPPHEETWYYPSDIRKFIQKEKR